MLTIQRKVIDDAIMLHFRKHFNPQSPQIDNEFEFETKIDDNTYKVLVPYSNCQINIFDDEEISVTCCDFDVLFKIEGVETTLTRDLIVLEEELLEQHEIDYYDPDSMKGGRDYENDKNN